MLRRVVRPIDAHENALATPQRRRRGHLYRIKLRLFHGDRLARRSLFDRHLGVAVFLSLEHGAMVIGGK